MMIVAVFALLVLWGQPCLATDKAPQETVREDMLRWLERYRDATPEFKPGERLTFDDLEKIRPFIVAGYLAEFAFPGVELEIAPAGEYAPHKAYRAATEQFSAQTGLAEDGALEGYVAGQPFGNDRLDPADPTSGLKAAWNFNFRWQHYGHLVGRFGTILIRDGGEHAGVRHMPDDLIRGGGGAIERVMVQRYQRVYFSHLAMHPENQYRFPAPDAGEYEWKDYTEFTEPYELRGQRIVVHRAADPHLPDQAWTYVPAMRKVRRVSAEEKSDSFFGTDTTLDDFYGYSGRVLDYEWKFHGWKDVLHVMNSRHSYPHYHGPRGRVPLDRWELRKCAAVELVPKNPHHPYSSKFIFFDAQTYRTTMAVAFNREGKLWKIWHAQDAWSEETKDEPGMNHGTFVSRFLGIIVIDVQSGQATLFPTFTMGYPKVDPAQVSKLFDLNKLTAGRR